MLFLAFYVYPSSRNASLDDSADFVCAAVAEVVYWEIDGYSQASVFIIERGISEAVSYDPVSGVITSVVTVTCSPTNNNTQLRCIAYDNNNYYSGSKARLLIQGKRCLYINHRYSHLSIYIYLLILFIYDLSVANNPFSK